MEIEVRQVDSCDAEAVAALSGEFGYPVSAAVMEERIQCYEGLDDRVVYVACLRGAVVGWIDIGAVRHLQAEPYGEIGGLVVSGNCRNAGIGSKLVSRAERWVRERGLTKVVVRSQIAREAAHRFYLREGYERTKTSAVFSKMLPRDRS
jgi:GNAT superfamily N-acetyltransferase